MAFMEPQYDQGIYVRCEDEEGGESLIPLSYFEPEHHGKRIGVERGIFARLSAPGYLDCTEWAGPFGTEDEARDYIVDTFEVDPDTGDELPEEDSITVRAG